MAYQCKVLMTHFTLVLTLKLSADVKAESKAESKAETQRTAGRRIKRLFVSSAQLTFWPYYFIESGPDTPCFFGQ
jgi:hypothetical protein